MGRLRKYISKSLLLFWAGMLLYPAPRAWSAVSFVDIGFRAITQVPPNPITNLSALTGSAEGAINLTWTAPDLFPGVALNQYEIRYATNSVSIIGGTTTWWNNAPGDFVTNYPIPTHAGDTVNTTFNALTPGVTYYFAIKSMDEFNNNALIDTLASSPTNQANSVALDLAPPVITGLFTSASTTSITLSWSASTATDINSYKIYWSTSSPATVFVPTVTVASPATYYAFNNLIPLNTYFFYVTAVDNGLLESTASAIVGDYPRLPVPLAPSTFSAISASTTTITWQWQNNSNNQTGFRVYSSSGGIVAQVNSLIGAGSLAQVTETGLSPNLLTTRYVRAFNAVGESQNSNTVLKYTLSNPPAGSAFTSVFIASAGVSWTANNNPGATLYEVQYSTSSGFTTYNSSFTATLSAVLNSLSPNTTYFARIRSQNGEGINSSFDNIISSVTFPGGPQGLTATGGYTKVTLTWNPSNDPNLKGYFIYRSTSLAMPFVKLNLVPVTTNYYQDLGLTNGILYYYAVTAVNNSGEESPFSAITSAMPVKSAPPLQPTGVNGFVDSTGRFTLTWNPVTMSVDGSSFAQISNYEVFKSSDYDLPFSLRAVVPGSTQSWTSSETVPPAAWYYLRALDTSFNESANSIMIQSLSPAQASMVLGSPDQTAFVVFSPQDKQALNAATNNRSEDVRMTMTRRTDLEVGNTLGYYEINAFGAVSGAQIKDMNIPRPTLLLQFRYSQGISGSPLAKGAIMRSFKGTPKDVSIYWNNGFEPVKIGGDVDLFKGNISIKTAKPLGAFQVKNVLRATDFTLDQLTPRKIFTPNGDGINDDITLYLENPNDSPISQASIYDITGAEVADFEQGTVAGKTGVISLRWDGRDKTGSIVPSGVYIYQIKAEGKVLNGTIVVAK